MSNRWWSYGVWALVAGSAGLLGLRLLVDKPAAGMPPAVAGAGLAGDPADVLRRDLPSSTPLPLSAAAAATEPVPNTRFRLFKVLIPPAQARQHEAAALIAVDGLPARTYRVGEAVVGAVVLQSVQPQGAMLGPADGPAALVLQVTPPGVAPTAMGADARRLPAESQPVIHAASAPAVNRAAVPVSDPDHGVDASNH